MTTLNGNISEDTLAKYRAEDAALEEAAKAYTVGERIKPHQLPEYSGFRTLYPITRGEELAAYVGVKTGWGKGWRLFPLKVAPKGATLNLGGFQPDDDHDRRCSNKEGAAKELARLISWHPDLFKTPSQFADANKANKLEELKHAEARLADMEAAQVETNIRLVALSTFSMDLLTELEQAALDRMVAELKGNRDTRVIHMEIQKAYIKKLEAGI